MHPGIKMHTEQIQIPADGIQLHLNALILEVIKTLLTILMEPLVPILLLDLLCHLNNILGMITLFRQRIRLSKQLIIAGQNTLCQHVDLMAGIIDIVLTQHIIAAGLHDTGQSIAPGSTARMAAVQITCRIGRHILDQYFLAIASIVLPPVISLGKHRINHRRQSTGLHAEIDKTRLDCLHTVGTIIICPQILHQRHRNVHWRLMQGTGKTHCHTG